jgi:hypothetical protein
MSPGGRHITREGDFGGSVVPGGVTVESDGLVGESELKIGY